MRSNIKKLATVLLGCCVFSLSHAQTVVTTRGARACGDWNAERIEEREGRMLKAQVHQTWLVGYLSGMAAGAGVDLLSGVANEPLFAMVDEYCGANPAANLAQAGTDVARNLMQQKQIIYLGTRP